MIPEGLKKLVEILIDKTDRKQAIWNKGSGSNQFKLSMPNGVAVTISEYNERYNDDTSYYINIFNSNGENIENYSTVNGIKDDFILLSRCYKSAKDQYYKVEETIHNLIGLLSGSGTIGIQEDGNKENEDDDLPF